MGIGSGVFYFRKIIAHAMIIVMVCACILPLQAEQASAASKPDAVSLTSVTQSGKKITVKWAAVTECSGYQIQYADNRLFFGKSSVKIDGAETTSAKITASSTDTYYVRIRSMLTGEDGTTTYSGWTHSPAALKNKTISRKVLKKGLSKFELRKAAGQKVPGFDTLQGSCYNNGYGYYLLENRNISYYKGRCKIVKVRLSDMKVTKVSAALKLSHGNDMTYDTKRNRIVVAHSTPVPKKISIVSPSSLTVTKSLTVELPDTIKGISDSTLKKYKKNGTYSGFGAIAYNQKHDKYVVCLRGKTFHHLMVLNAKFKPVIFHWLDRSSGEMAKQMLQGIDSYDDYIMVGQSYGYGYTSNNILVYSWDGEYLSKLNLGTEYELESIYHAGGNFYAGYYTSGYTTITKKLYRRNFIFRLSGY